MAKVCKTKITFEFQINAAKSPWRNRLARSAVNRKVGGSSPPGDALFVLYAILFIGCYKFIYRKSHPFFLSVNVLNFSRK